MNDSGYRRLVSTVLKVDESDVLPLQDDDIEMIGRTVCNFASIHTEVLIMRFDMFRCGRQHTIAEIGKACSLSPEDVLWLEAHVLSKLRSSREIRKFLQFSRTALEKQKRIKETPLFKKNIDCLGLSVRTLNVLNSENMRTVGELATKTAAELLSIHGFGRKSLDDLKYSLNSLGLELAHNG